MAQKPKLYSLNDFEKWWRDRYSLLEAHGYRLRPRYRPGWTPSWIGTNQSPILCEDAIFTLNRRTMDATQICDGKVVFLKKVIRGGPEREIVEYLTTEEKLKDPRNHCVHVLDHFPDDEDPITEFIVMPLLRPFNSPPFYSVDEVTDFIRQSIEALSFIHSQNVAHRDYAALNIMLDGSDMYPDGFHPSDVNWDLSGAFKAKYKTRRQVNGVRYFVTDFGISTRFQEGESHLVTGSMAQDEDVPELSETVPYDAFAVDVFTLGNLYKRLLIEPYINLKFLRPLVQKMTLTEPKERPTVDEALREFEKIISHQSTAALRWRLKSADSGRIERLYHDVASSLHVGGLLARRVLRTLYPFSGSR